MKKKRNKFIDSRLRDGATLSREDLLLVEAEDNRLRAIGIDPDGDPIDIMVELERRAEALGLSRYRKA